MFDKSSFSSRIKSSLRSGVAGLTVAAALAVPLTAFAETNKTYWKNTPVQLTNRSAALTLVWAPATAANHISHAKTIVHNTGSTTVIVQCELWDGAAEDITTATLPGGAYATLYAQVAIATQSPAQAPTFFCYIASGTGTATAEWTKMTVDDGAPSVSTVQR